MVTAVRVAGLLPDDAGYGKATDASLPGSPGGRAQITRFSVALDGCLGY